MVDVSQLDNIETNIMDGLKDFQRATVERIDYLYRNGQNRVLVSDEVGLGKTLVAKGVIAKFTSLRKEEDDNLVKVVYICSNSTIVDQNLDKLKIVDDLKPESSYTSRLSMQHLNIFNQEYDEEILDKYIQLIPLTPETSFKVSNSSGTVHERALMFAILKRIPELEDYLSELEETFRFGVKYWEDIKNYWEIQVRECNKKSKGEYERYMLEKLCNPFDNIQNLINLCEKFKKKGFDKKQAKPIIVEFRKNFADISLNKLDPDLIIMDEFQRFRHLLNSDKGSEMEKLTTKFFNSDDVRILMLSATPYKMYSTLEEISEENVDAHYSEFLQVVDFLKESEEEKDKFTEVWSDYSIKLKEFNLDKTSFISVKKQAEEELYKNICRTERFTENNLADIIDSSDAENSLQVLNEDIRSYLEVQKLLDDIKLGINVPIDYIKSSPYIMSFMNHYQLKKKIKKYFEKHPEDINKMQKNSFWLNQQTINNYNPIPYNNARLAKLMESVLKDNASKILWIPPSMPYYELGGEFKDSEHFSKTLIFSSWEMVPRMISSLVSYEVERQTIGNLHFHKGYFNPRSYSSSKMNFSSRHAIDSQMSLFTLLYPSIFLADVYNPIECLNNNLGINEIEIEIKKTIKHKLDELPFDENKDEDSRWYYLAPLLFDLNSDVESWFEQFDLTINLDDFGKGFKDFYDLLKKQYDEVSHNRDKLGKKPKDLIDVLCDMAIAAPAICVYRSYQKELPSNVSMEQYMVGPTKVARSFIRLMNLPESVAVLNLIYKNPFENEQWKFLLKYSKDGNLQAVFDEYVHLLANGLDKDYQDRIEKINNRFLDSFNFKTTSYDFDTFDRFKSKIENDDEKTRNYSLRTHYAASFTKGRSDESDSNRRKTVRDAFNSPFRPFVLASTSIGQEGLDFHNYCRKIVHWNLPSNPIDLEQREGRINRFECLAIRQNVAKRYGWIRFDKNIWEELFDVASGAEKRGNCSDLIPYWGLSDSRDMIRIERIVPMYPFSRDENNYDRLINILSLYRLTLGQPRQEELLDSVLIDFDIDKKELDELFINLSPYYKNI